MRNLQLIEDQPHWRVWIVARFAQLMGVLIHVEGIPFGSSSPEPSVADAPIVSPAFARKGGT